MRRLAIVFLAAAAWLLADGGAIQLRQQAGPFWVTVFASPAPLHAGPADLSVLVQDRETLQSVLDSAVTLRLQHESVNIDAVATRALAQNKLLYAASVNLAGAGEWKYSVTVRRGSDQGMVSGSMTIAPAEAPLAAHWVSIAFAPLCILIFALHQRLGSARRAAI
jgi:hypothetical protein